LGILPPPPGQFRGRIIGGAVVVAVVALGVGLVARRLTAWSPPPVAAGRSYATVLDRYLASTYGPNGGVFGSAGHWFCATRFLGATPSGERVTVYAWAECDETKRSGTRIVTGSGDSVPVVVHLRGIVGHLKGVGFDEPFDAPYYEPDVHRLFPSNMADWILSHPSGVGDLEQGVIAQAQRALLRK
jgi:hypothetical protein